VYNVLYFNNPCPNAEVDIKNVISKFFMLKTY